LDCGIADSPIANRNRQSSIAIANRQLQSPIVNRNRQSTMAIVNRQSRAIANRQSAVANG
jgi:hypothetical protein